MMLGHGRPHPPSRARSQFDGKRSSAGAAMGGVYTHEGVLQGFIKKSPTGHDEPARRIGVMHPFAGGAAAGGTAGNRPSPALVRHRLSSSHRSLRVEVAPARHLRLEVVVELIDQRDAGG